MTISHHQYFLSNSRAVISIFAYCFQAYVYIIIFYWAGNKMSISRIWKCSNIKPVLLMLALLMHARAAIKEEDKDSGTIKDYLIMALVVIAIALVLLAVILLMRGLKMCRCFNCYCLNRSYKRYCRQHSTPNTTIMPEQEFERRKDALVEAINSTKSHNG